MKALSIRQPWAWLILNAGKDIENRDWKPWFRGRFLVHAGKGMTRDEYDGALDTIDYVENFTGKPLGVSLPPFESLERGGIVGSVELVNCVTEEEAASPWFFGRYGFVLSNPMLLPFRPFKGQLGFFEVPDGC